MVLSFLIGFSAVFATSEGIKASQARSRREEHRSRKNNLVVHCPKGSKYSVLLEGRRVVLSGDKLYVDTGTEYNVPFGHPFAGYYLPYPDQRYSGLVSSITDEAPIMNWIYVHRETHEIKFGNRLLAEGHLTGPWDCTRQDRRLTFGGWEGFCAVREGDFWALYFDCDGDRLRDKVATGTPVIELELLRKEMRTQKPPPPPTPEEQAEMAAQAQAQAQAEQQAQQQQAQKQAQAQAQQQGQNGQQQAQGGEQQVQNGQQQAQQQAQQQSQAPTQKQAQNGEQQAQNGQREAQNGQKQKQTRNGEQQARKAQQAQQTHQKAQPTPKQKKAPTKTKAAGAKPPARTNDEEPEKRKSTMEEDLERIPTPELD